MFVPNGQGTLEWRLGWAATIPTGTFLMVLPPPDHAPNGLHVTTGVIPAKTVNAMTDRGGMSIAIRPEHPVTVHGGQEIARIMLLHPDSLRATTRTETIQPATIAADTDQAPAPRPATANPGPKAEPEARKSPPPSHTAAPRNPQAHSAT